MAISEVAEDNHALQAHNAPVESGESSATPALARWSLAGRIAFRFLSVYILLFLQWGPILSIPFPKLDDWNTGNWNALTLLVARHVLHTTVDVNAVNSGSGDTKAQWVQTGFCLVFALASAAIWSVADRRRLEYDRLYDWLRVYVRYMLFFELAAYGLIKIIPVQFGIITPDKLAERIGDSTPMGLLWTFMAASTPYTIFGGTMELVSGLLLTVRRTTTLGALLACAVMANVFMLNMCYDVSVKLLSGQLLLLGVFLLAPDMRRLTDVLLLGKGAPPMPQRRLFASRRMEIAAHAVGAIVVIGFLVLTVQSSLAERKTMTAVTSAKSPLAGYWDVDSFEQGELTAITKVTAATLLTWQSLDIVESNYGTFFIITAADGRRTGLRCVDRAAPRTLTLTRMHKPSTRYELAYSESGKDRLTLVGTHDGLPLKIILHRSDEKREDANYLLMRTGFHWISETTNNQ